LPDDVATKVAPSRAQAATMVEEIAVTLAAGTTIN
jgi:hypothetical protein